MSSPVNVRVGSEKESGLLGAATNLGTVKIRRRVVLAKVTHGEILSYLKMLKQISLEDLRDSMSRPCRGVSGESESARQKQPG